MKTLAISSAESFSENSWQIVAKRAIDFFGALVGLLILSPIMLMVAIAIKLTSPGPVIFKQERLGYLGEPFIFLKFRSMDHRCDDLIHREYIEKFIENNYEETPQLYKITKDPRITSLGKFLRKTSLDELPQLFNVLSGEMSLVGPRPPIEYEVKMYKKWHKQRMHVKPGITGLWQVEGRSRMLFDEMVRLDIQYAKSWSIWLDFKIIFKTFKVILNDRGAC